MNNTIAAQTDMNALWMPFTANRQFKMNPRLLVSAEGMYYKAQDGRKIMDGTAGLWCVNAGHGHKKIIDAIQQQAVKLDYCPSFQIGHPDSFKLANRLANMAPSDLNHIFFTNSGSEAVDTALKIALAYHSVKGEGGRQRLIGRERGYHGVGFGGISVGGIVNNRKFFGSLLAGVDHLPHTHNLKHNAFSRGEPTWGSHYAEALESLVALHDASTIAAVIVEPVAGSTGVLLPPQGYLQRLREICDKYGILLIFDEVITGFGRLGSPFASHRYGVVPDMIAIAKGMSNGAVPMGGVLIRKEIYDSFMGGADENIELFHGYTYSAHPLACAAANATLDVYEEEGLMTRASELSSYWEDAVHNLRSFPHVIDLRNVGLVAGIELESRPGKPGGRAFEVFLNCFEKGILIRTTGDTIALSPPLIIEKNEIDQLFETIGKALLSLS